MHKPKFEHSESSNLGCVFDPVVKTLFWTHFPSMVSAWVFQFPVSTHFQEAADAGLGAGIHAAQWEIQIELLTQAQPQVL